MKSTADVYPCTIVFDRYSGVYSGGRWLAFDTAPEYIPKGINAGDKECASWWYAYNDGALAVGLIGKGDTPQKALDNLKDKISKSTRTVVIHNARDRKKLNWCNEFLIWAQTHRPWKSWSKELEERLRENIQARNYPRYTIKEWPIPDNEKVKYERTQNKLPR